MPLVVDAKNALLGAPALALPDDEFADAVVPDIDQILDFAHAVFFAIAFVQVLELRAGKILATEAELAFALRANPHETSRANLRAILSGNELAAGARVFAPQMRFANPAIHAAGSDETLR
jgi:hypothetical protein